MSKEALLDSLRTLFTTVKAAPADDLSGIEDIMDQWNEPNGQHKIPAEGEIKTGPKEDASGDGAFRMVGQYSHPAPQPVATEAYSQMSGMFEKMSRAMKAQQAQIQAMAAVLFEKAEPAKAAPEVDSFLAKAETRLKMAKMALRKADMADEDEKDDREDCMEKAERMLAAAKRLIAKAEAEAEDEADEEKAEGVEKAIMEHRSLARRFAKARAEYPAPAAPVVETVKAEDAQEKKDAKQEEKRVEAKEEDAKDELKRVEAKKSDDPNHIEIIETTVKGLMEKFMGQSKHQMPDFVKALPIESISDRVHEAIDNGTLQSDSEIMKATDLLGRVNAAKLGQYDGARLQDEIAAAPDNVRSLFKIAA